MVDFIADVVERVRPGQSATVEPLPGGITNANFKVDLGDEQVVVRVPGNNTELLGIDRASEVAANRAAAAVGVAPEVVAVDEETGCIVTRFLNGRPIPMAELATEPTLGSVIATLQRVHRAGSVKTEFNHFDVIRSYHDAAQRRGVPRAVRLRAGERRPRPHRDSRARSAPAFSATTTSSTPTCSMTARSAFSTGSTRGWPIPSSTWQTSR